MKAKRSTATVGEWTIIVVAAVATLGLGLAVVGLLLKNDMLNRLGLVMASPLYVVVLPCCILLIVVMCLFCVIDLFRRILRKARCKNGDAAEGALREPAERGACGAGESEAERAAHEPDPFEGG